MDQFLAFTARHGIWPVFVLFSSCWDPNAKAGPQHPPIPGVHNSGWVQAPGAKRLADKAGYATLEADVEDVVSTFGKDRRILAWNVWNEPNNEGRGNYAPTPGKKQLVVGLLDEVFTRCEAAIRSS